MVLDVLPQNAMAGGIAEVEKLANVVAASVSVPDQGQCKRTAQRFGNWAVRRLAEAADQLAPPARCRVELDTRQVICRSRRIDALQLERHSTFQETMFGGSRGASFPSATLYAPKLAKFYGGAALFQWDSEGKNDGYVLLITDEDETQIVKQPVKDTHYELPAGQSKLRAGEIYYWRVQVLPATTAGDPLGIKVVSAAERQAIDKALAAAHGADAYQTGLARANVFTDHRVWFDAIGAYTELIAKYPDRAELYEQRGRIYAQVDATTKLADADVARATALTKSTH